MINVAEQVPVARVDIGGNQRVVDADGRLLPDTTVARRAAARADRIAAGGHDVSEPGASAAIAVLAAAPYALLAHIANATSTSAHGVIVQLRNGPQLYFGQRRSSTEVEAAVAVLQNQTPRAPRTST